MKQYIRFDWLIKYMLRDKANYTIVDGFLSELLGQDIQIEEVLESENNQKHYDSKYSYVDMLAKNQYGELIIIELHYEADLDYFHRILYSTSRLITQYTSKGKPYSHVRKIISVSIVYFDLRYGKDYLYHGTTVFRGLHYGDELQLTERQQWTYHCHNIADIYPEYYLIKVEKFKNQITNTLDQWIYFLKNENIREDFAARGLLEAREKLEVVKLSAEQRRTYEIYLEKKQHKDNQIDLNRLGEYCAGERDKALEIAENLLNLMDDKLISDVTGLSIDIIKQLRVTKNHYA